jgi:hypothetical protein
MALEIPIPSAEWVFLFQGGPGNQERTFKPGKEEGDDSDRVDP